MTYEGFRLKLLKQYRLRFAKARHKKLKNTDFTRLTDGWYVLYG